VRKVEKEVVQTVKRRQRKEVFKVVVVRVVLE
jgi:hypothetical protein